MPNGAIGREPRLLAMLIDGENAQPSLIEHVLAETAKYGLVTTRRIYSDWTEAGMSGWKDSLHSLAVQPVQQFRYTVGKNATDSALTFDAMDLVHSGSVGGFCIASSDSDYTRLAMRIREGGMFVMGVGRSNTPKAIVNACEVFAYTENLSPRKNRDSHQEKNRAAEWTKLMKQAIDMATQDEGWALLANVGNNLRKLDPAFDSRTYGHSQLSQLVKSRQDTFEVEEKSPVRVRVRS